MNDFDIGPSTISRVEVDEERLYFAWRQGTGHWHRLPQTFDASILSDEAQMPGTAKLALAISLTNELHQQQQARRKAGPPSAPSPATTAQIPAPSSAPPTA